MKTRILVREEEVEIFKEACSYFNLNYHRIEDEYGNVFFQVEHDYACTLYHLGLHMGISIRRKKDIDIDHVLR